MTHRGEPIGEGREIVPVDGRRGLVLDRVEGADVLGALAARPWRLLALGGVLGSVHASIHGAVAPATLPGLRDRLAARIDLAATTLRDLTGWVQGLLAVLPDGDRLCHGDDHPANVLQTADVATSIGRASRGGSRW